MKATINLLSISIVLILTGYAQLAPIVLDNLPEPEPPVIEEPVPEPPVVVEPEPEQPAQQHSEEGSQNLLVKPKADTSGNLVVLLPAKWNNDFRDVWLIDKNGTRHNDTGRRNINPPPHDNGNRRHIWFKKSGASYGNGTLVVVLKSGTKRLQHNFGKRTEKTP